MNDSFVKNRISYVVSHFNIRETLSYAWVGVVGVAIDVVAYLLFRSTLDTPPVLTTILSSSIAAALTFPLNAHFTFRKKDKLRVRFVQYLSISFFGTALGGMLVFIGFNLIGLDDRIAKAISVVCVAATQFILNKFIAFK